MPTSKRYWLVTWNNPPQDWKDALGTLEAQWYVAQLEQGENGTPHIQAVVWYRNPVSTKFWRGKPVWSKPIPSEDVDRTVAYCTKEDTRIEGPVRFGKAPSIAKQSDIVKRGVRDWDRALDMAKEGRITEVQASILIPYVQNLQRVSHLFGTATGGSTTRGLWIFGPSGVGKSHYAREHYPNPYLKALNKWWDGYNGQKFVLLDDMDRVGVCLSHYLKIWTDKYEFSGEIKGGNVVTNHELFIITSQYLPSQLWDDKEVVEAITRRCKFIRFHSYGQYDVGTDFGVIPRSDDALGDYLRFFTE